MTVSEEILTLDDVAATLSGMAGRVLPFDPDVVKMMAAKVSEAADRAQEVADLRAAIALLSGRRSIGD
jgi:hypothetical protein